MKKRIQSALLSVFYKDGLEPIVRLLSESGVTIYSTGGTQKFIENLGVKVVPVENLTTYPSILGGRVKTLHPSVFGGILGKRDDETHREEMKQYHIPEIDLVMVDLYPFEETAFPNPRPTGSSGRASKGGAYPAQSPLNDESKNIKTSKLSESSGIPPLEGGEAPIIEMIDIGGPSMIRAAAKNYKDVVVVAHKRDYLLLEKILREQKGETTPEQRRLFAAKAFDVCTAYDTAISNYFHQTSFITPFNRKERVLRYGENPHQQARFFGDTDELFEQLNGKELSYNNLVDIDSAIQLISEAPPSGGGGAVFAIIKHTNVCGIAQRPTVKESWDAALAGDPESAFGGVLACSGTIDKATADAVHEIFFEVLIAPGFDAGALTLLKSKKNRILLRYKNQETGSKKEIYRSLLNGVLIQEVDEGNYSEWKEVGGRETTGKEKEDLKFANQVCKHLKSNAIALVRNKQLLGKGCGQTSRIDALRQAVEKAKRFHGDLSGAVMASDAFFPFDDCVKLGLEAGIKAFIQPGGSVRDNDSVIFCQQNQLAMVLTGMRHFKH